MNRKHILSAARLPLSLLFAAALCLYLSACGGPAREEAGSGAAEDTPPARAAAEEAAGETPGSAEAAADEFARFSSLYYYDAEKLDRYIAYEAARPDLAAEDVVWRVEARLDRPFYGDISVIEDVDALPVLANKYYRFPDDFVPKDLVSIDGAYQVTAETKAAYDALLADAKADGCNMYAGSAYRSIATQVDLYARYVREDGPEAADTYSSRPGHSEHHTGRTIDLLGSAGSLRGFGGTKEADWVRENAWKYGFIVRYTEENEDVTGYMSEPWHITYVGKEAAALMREQGIGSLEEYFVKYVDNTPAAN